MWTIHAGAVAQRRGISLQEFQDRFVEICESHQAQGRAWAFAFLLYDFTHPHLRQLLSNDHYWDDLDQLSGRDLTVFSFHCPPARLAPQSDGLTRKSLHAIQTQSPPSPELVWRYFDDATVRPPCILFFQVQDQKISDSLSIQLRQKNLEAAHQELRSILETAVDSLNRLDTANEPTHQDVFNLIKQAVIRRQQHNTVLRISVPIVRLVEIATLLEFLSRIVR